MQWVELFCSIAEQPAALGVCEHLLYVGINPLLLCGFMVLVLSGIFAYGVWLQREHDQTV